MIRLEHIEKTFKAGTPDENRLFTDFSLTVPEGSFVSVVGSNGSGKTTMLNLISGTLTPDAGRIYADDTDITAWPEHKRARRIGRVFQDPQKGTCADLTILENMALADNKGRPYSLKRAVEPARRAYYQELLSQCRMGLEGRLGVAVGSLSGGQRQALALVIDCLNPERVVIGSIFQRSEKLLRPAMERVLRQECLPQTWEAVQIVPAQLGNRIGDLAALSVAMERETGEEHEG